MQDHCPLLLVGNGTNTLYADAGARGIVARIALNNYEIDDYGDGTALLRADAGVSWPRLLNDLATPGWGGLEFGPGIPGTLGGGIISNAGAHNSEIGEVLEWVEVLDARLQIREGFAPAGERANHFGRSLEAATGGRLIIDRVVREGRLQALDVAREERRQPLLDDSSVILGHGSASFICDGNHQSYGADGAVDG